MAGSRRGRKTRRVHLGVLGLLLVVVAVGISGFRSFERVGLLERWFGWQAIRGFVARAIESSATTPLIAGLLIVGATLVISAAVSRW